MGKRVIAVSALMVCATCAGLTEARPPAAAAPQNEEYVLTLGEQRFDPLAGVPAAPEGLNAVRQAGPDLHLVQYVGATDDAWLGDLAARGLHVVQYIHPYTYVVWGEAEQLPQAARAAAVRWTGPFLPAYRLLPAFRSAEKTATQARALMVRAARPDAVSTQIESLGLKTRGLRNLNDRFAIVSFDSTAAQLADVAQVPGVYSVRPVPTDGGLRSEMSNQVCANNVNGSNQAFPGYQTWLAGIGLDGTGVIMANVDGGVQTGHPDLVNRFLGCTGTTCGNSATDNHGTHTAGIMAADGSSGTTDSFGFLRGLGVAPGANMVEQVYSPWFTQAGGMLLLMKDSYNNGASLSGNSWGPSGTPQGYDDDTMQVDIGVRDADADTPGNQPLTYVLSFMNGNGGVSSQGTPDEAKNLFNIGSTKMQSGSGAQYLDINNLSANSAHGPALDGRTIPHMVAPGCSVDSTITASTYGLMCGTSMASPHVAGAVALFIEYYRGLPGFTVDPSPALIKAAFLPVARDLAGNLDADGGVLGHPFDSKQGWGRMDLPAVLDPQVQVRYFDDPVIFDSSGEEWSQFVSADDPNQPIRMMLVWTDAPGHGLGGSTPAWNNNLDLIVEDGGTTYRGNAFDSNGWSQAGGAADTKNNTEGVFIGPTAPGTYNIRVVATNINSDGVPSFGDATDQDFALVCYNCALDPTYTLEIVPATGAVCAPDSFDYQVNVGSVMGFSDPVTLSAVGLPAGATASFDVNPVTPPGTSTITVTVDGSVASGNYAFDVFGDTAGDSKSEPAQLGVSAGLPGIPALTSPTDGATDVSTRPTLTWSAAAGAQTYTLEVATDGTFQNIVLSLSGLGDTMHAVDTQLSPAVEHYWRVKATNGCGDSEYSAAWRFTTRLLTAILLVDDDDNAPDVQAHYTTALTSLGMDYDVWSTGGTDSEPTEEDLAEYGAVIWFTGDSYGGNSGPGSAGETALAAFLADGKNLFISSQDYYYDRGLTTMISTYLGAQSVSSDVSQTAVSGQGAVFGSYGTLGLSYPFANYSDRVTPDATAATAFNGNAGIAAISKETEVYRTVYFGFPWEAISGEQNREDVLMTIIDWFRPYSDCNGNGVADHVDIHTGSSLDEDANGVPDECEYLLGDMNCDDSVDFGDINAFVSALTEPDEYAILYPGCNPLAGDLSGNGSLGFEDINPFVDLMISKFLDH